MTPSLTDYDEGKLWRDPHEVFRIVEHPNLRPNAAPTSETVQRLTWQRTSRMLLRLIQLQVNREKGIHPNVWFSLITLNWTPQFLQFMQNSPLVDWVESLYKVHISTVIHYFIHSLMSRRLIHHESCFTKLCWVFFRNSVQSPILFLGRRQKAFIKFAGNWSVL